MDKKRAPLNRTLTLAPGEEKDLSSEFLLVSSPVSTQKISDRLIAGNLFEVIDFLPDSFVDLLFLDPPYNLSKDFNGLKFRRMDHSDYENWIDSWLSKMIRLLKPNASIYICCDWKSSPMVYNAACKYFNVMNRITWEREKGRGALNNWKNSMEDIWFCTLTNEYTFNINDVKINRTVLAPYKNNNGEPKDWKESNQQKTRLTHPSNLWTDITVPFWSMPENTDHPTQKPEKLLAKIILASSKQGDIVFDPFAGSGTTLVTAKKLNRTYCGVELNSTFAALAIKRLKLAESDKSIQGYENGIFWERNSIRKG